MKKRTMSELIGTLALVFLAYIGTFVVLLWLVDISPRLFSQLLRILHNWAAQFRMLDPQSVESILL